MTKKERILDTMMVLVARNGLQETPLSEIAKHAKVATGTIYHHFKNKQNILDEVYAIKRKEIADLLNAQLDSNDTYEGQVKKLWMTTYEYYRKNSIVFLFIEQVNRTPKLSLEVQKEIANYHTDILTFITKGQSDGVFESMNPWLMLELLHGNIATTVGLLFYHNIDLSQKDILQAQNTAWRIMTK